MDSAGEARGKDPDSSLHQFNQEEYERRMAELTAADRAEAYATKAKVDRLAAEVHDLKEEADAMSERANSSAKPWAEMTHNDRMHLIKSMQAHNPNITAQDITAMFQRNPDTPTGTLMMNIISDSVVGFLPALGTAASKAGTSGMEGLKTVLSPEFRKALGSDLSSMDWMKRVASPMSGAVESYYSKQNMQQVGQAVNEYLKSTGQGTVKVTKAAFEQFDSLVRQFDRAANSGDTKSIANVVDKIAADQVLSTLMTLGMAKGGELATRGLVEAMGTAKVAQVTEAMALVNKTQDVRGYVTDARDVVGGLASAGRGTDGHAGDPALKVIEGKVGSEAQKQVSTRVTDQFRERPSLTHAAENTAVPAGQYGEFGYRKSEVDAIARIADRHDVTVDMRPGNTARLNWNGQLLKDEPIKTKTITAEEVKAGIFPRGSEGAAGYVPSANRPANYGSLSADQKRLWDARISEHHAQADAIRQLEQGVKLRVTTDDGKSRELTLQAKPDAHGVIRSTGGDFGKNLVFTGDNDIMALRHGDGRLFYTDKHGNPITKADLELDLPASKRSARAQELGSIVSADRAREARVFRELQADKATGVLHPGGRWDTDHVKVKRDTSSLQSLLEQQAAMLELGHLSQARDIQAQIDRLGDHGITKDGLDHQMRQALKDGDEATAKRLNQEMKKKGKGIKKVDCTSHNINLKAHHDSRANGGKAGLRIGGGKPVRTAYSDPLLRPRLGSYDPTETRTKAFSSKPRLTRAKRR